MHAQITHDPSLKNWKPPPLIKTEVRQCVTKEYFTPDAVYRARELSNNEVAVYFK
jgi:hypothetical protein